MAKKPDVVAKASNKPKAREMGWREYERTTDGVKLADALKIRIDQIFVRKGFNPRDISKEDTQTKIRAIADSYKAGRYVKPIEVALVGGRAEVVDGHCRLEAVKLANKELDAEAKIQELMCMPFKGDELDRLVHTYLGNEGEKLTPIECSDLVNTMITTGGLQRQAVADRLGVTIGWVDRLIKVYKLPDEVKQQIRDGKVSLDVALKKFKDHGVEGVAKAVNEAIEVAEASGESKATTKHTKAKEPKLDKDGLKAALSVGRYLPPQTTKVDEVKDDKVYTVKVGGAVYRALLQLQAKVAEIDEGEDTVAGNVTNDAPEVEGAEGDGVAWPFKPVGESGTKH